MNTRIRVRAGWLAAAFLVTVAGSSLAGDPPVLNGPLHADAAVATSGGAPTLEVFRDQDRGRAAGGDNQTALTGRALPAPLIVVATGADGKPLAGAVVQFRLVAPQDHALGEATTGTDGRAAFNFATGATAAPYTVLARLHGEAGNQSETVFHLQVRRPAWAMFLLFGLFGGMGLFLYGMTIMSNALQRSAGRRLRTILSAVTANRFIGLAVGAFVTMLIQSSSATTVMLVSFVQAGLVTFSQTLGVILGADIGTTVTVQLIAFNLTDYALLVVAIGFTLRVLPRGGRLVSFGEILLGTGILFFGMQLPLLIGVSKVLGKLFEAIHEFAGTAGYFLIGMHAAAALYHHYGARDDTLRRMLPPPSGRS